MSDMVRRFKLIAIALGFAACLLLLLYVALYVEHGWQMVLSGMIVTAISMAIAPLFRP